MTSIIKEKITPPSCLTAMARPRLIDLINQASNASLVIINAGAGYGKTMLMAQCYTLMAGMHVWYRLSDRDHDPGVMATNIIAGLRRKMAGCEIGLTQDLTSVDSATKRGALLAVLASEIGQNSPRPASFFFDDFHIVNQTPPIMESVRLLLAHLPEGSRVFIAGREKPNLPLARMRTQRAILEIGREELAFTFDETARYFREHREVRASSRQIRNLHALSEGWPLAMVLLKALQQGEGVKAVSAPALGHALADHFKSEIWARLNSQLRTFLMECSLLEVIEPEVYDRAQNRGEPKAGGLLKMCEEQNLIAESPGAAGGSFAYRFQPLFREFLTQKLFQELGEARARELHRSFAEARGALGNEEGAIEYYLLANEPWRAAKVIESHGIQILESGKLRTMSSWLKKIPAPLFQEHPWLCYFQAQLEDRRGEPGKALTALDLARQGFNRTGERRGLFGAWLATGEILMYAGEDQRGQKAAAEALEWSAGPAEKVKAISQLASHLLLLGYTQKSLDLLTEAGKLCQNSRDQANAPITAAMLQHMYFTGRFEAILGETESLMAQFTGMKTIKHRLSVIYYRALALFETGSYRESLDLLDKWHEPIGEYRIFELACRWLKGQNLLYSGKADAGRKIINVVFEKQMNYKTPSLISALNCLGAFERQHGSIEQALEIHNWALKISRQKKSPYTVAVSLLEIAADKICSGRANGPNGEKELVEAFTIADKCHYQYVKSQIHFYRARLAMRKGDHQKAVAEISNCVIIAAGLGHSHFLVQEGRMDLCLLSIAFENGFERGYLTEIFSRIGPEVIEPLLSISRSKDAETMMAAITAIGQLGSPQASMRLRRAMRDKDPGVQAAAKEALETIRTIMGAPEDVLTEREMQVFGMLKQGLSNREVGARLFISEVTVKTHITRIFNKLGISKRSQIAGFVTKRDVESC